MNTEETEAFENFVNKAGAVVLAWQRDNEKASCDLDMAVIDLHEAMQRFEEALDTSWGGAIDDDIFKDIP